MRCWVGWWGGGVGVALLSEVRLCFLNLLAGVGKLPEKLGFLVLLLLACRFPGSTPELLRWSLEIWTWGIRQDEKIALSWP